MKEEFTEGWILASQNLIGSLLWSKKLSTPNRVQVSFSLKKYHWFQRKKCESFVTHLPVAILQLGERFKRIVRVLVVSSLLWQGATFLAIKIP